MHTSSRVRWIAVAAGVSTIAFSPIAIGQEQAWRRMLRASEAEQAEWISSDLARGMPVVDPDSGILTMLVLNKSAVTLPLIEKKIEEVLRSTSGAECFSDKSVD